jgi:hypothetical protein
MNPTLINPGIIVTGHRVKPTFFMMKVTKRSILIPNHPGATPILVNPLADK